MIEVNQTTAVAPATIKPAQVAPAQQAKPKISIVEVKKHLIEKRSELAVFIGDAKLLDTFIETIVQALYKNPALLNYETESLFMACKDAAKDGLMPDGKEAALVPYKGRITYTPMIGGYYKKTHRTGKVKELIVDVVWDCDKFQFINGDDQKIIHVPDILSVKTKIVAAYAIVKMNNGAVYREVMTYDEVEKIRSKSQSKAIWDEWTTEQYKKTVYRRLAKRLPIKEDLDSLIDSDNELFEDSKLDKLEEKVNGTTEER